MVQFYKPSPAGASHPEERRLPSWVFPFFFWVLIASLIAARIALFDKINHVVANATVGAHLQR